MVDMFVQFPCVSFQRGFLSSQDEIEPGIALRESMKVYVYDVEEHRFLGSGWDLATLGWARNDEILSHISAYHLVICYIAMERSTMLLIGKPSISMGHFPWLC